MNWGCHTTRQIPDRWVTPFRLAEMPLAEHGGRITGIAQHLRHGVFPLGQTIVGDGKRHRTIPRADRIPACHQSRPTGRTLCLDIVIQQPHPFAGQFVDAWRGTTPENTPAVATQFAVAEVVHIDQDDVGLGIAFLGHRMLRTSQTCCQQAEAGEYHCFHFGFHLFDCCLVNESVRPWLWFPAAVFRFSLHWGWKPQPRLFHQFDLAQQPGLVVEGLERTVVTRCSSGIQARRAWIWIFLQ